MGSETSFTMPAPEVDPARKLAAMLELVGVPYDLKPTVPEGLGNGSNSRQVLELLARSVQYQDGINIPLLTSPEAPAEAAVSEAELSMRAVQATGYGLKVPHVLRSGSVITAEQYGVAVAYGLFDSVGGSNQARYVVEVPPVLGIKDNKAYVILQGRLGMVN